MLDNTQKYELKNLAVKIRMGAVHAIAKAVLPAGHIGGAMSIAEVLAVLYGKEMDTDPADPKKFDRDTLVLSKGHTAPALYAVLAEKGFFPREWLDTMNYGGTNLPSHVDRLKVPGVDATAGSLGQGLSIALGIALANRIAGCDRYSYCIVGDGESQEGQVWEAAMYAAHEKVDHLIAFVDWNKKQLDGDLSEVCDMGSFEEKFRAFGWFAQTVDGHDVEQIDDAIQRAKAQSGKPSVIVLDTVKGKDALDIETLKYNHVAPIGPEKYDQLMAHFQSELVS